MDHSVETCLFHGRGRRRVLPGCMCDIIGLRATRHAISRHARVELKYGHLIPDIIDL